MQLQEIESVKFTITQKLKIMSTATLKSIPTWEEVYNNFTARVNSLISSPINKNLNQVLTTAKTYFNNRQLPSAMSLALKIDGTYLYDNFLHNMYNDFEPMTMDNFDALTNINMGVNVPKYHIDGNTGNTITIYVSRLNLYMIYSEIVDGDLSLDDIHDTYPDGLYLQVAMMYGGNKDACTLVNTRIALYTFNKKKWIDETVIVASSDYDKILVQGGFCGHTNSYLEQE